MKPVLLVLQGLLSWCAFRLQTRAIWIVTILLSLSTPSCATTQAYRPSAAFLCAHILPQKHGASVVGRDKAYVGQLFPSKSFLGPAQPQCPPNAEELFTREDKRIVKEGATAIGHQFGKAMVSCDMAMESLTNMTDHHMAAYQKANPKVVQLVLDNCRHDLEVVPELPAYESDELAAIAKQGFEDGFGAAVNDAFKRIMIVELAAVAVEIAFIEAAPLIELSLMRGIRRSLDVLREMPVFLPLSVNGVGVSIKIARLAKGSSRVLARNMEKVGKVRLPGEFTHHIAAHGDQRALRSVEIMEGFGIKVDNEVNGVFLPGYASSPNPLKKVVHGNLHTDAYFKAVEKRLGKAVTRADAEQTLRDIGWELEHGIIPK